MEVVLAKALLIHGQMSKCKSIVPLYICFVMGVAFSLSHMYCFVLVVFPDLSLYQILKYFGLFFSNTLFILPNY